MGQSSLSGRIVNASTGDAVEFAIAVIIEQGLWAVANDKGEFVISKVSPGKFTLEVSCLGFVKYSKVLDSLCQFPEGNMVYLTENNLSLDEVLVTAQKKSEELSNSYVIDRKAIDHVQALGINDLLTLLPGAQTKQTISLISEQRLAVRSQSNSEMDNPTFGTAIEVDGVRLSNNGTFNTDNSLIGLEGTGTRNIGINNIESVEVVTGLPSVEYGDLSSGLLKINTKKGKSPYELTVVSKPQIKSFAMVKGYQLGKKAGILNTNIEQTKSISDRSSPYTTYVRNNLALTYRNNFGNIGEPLDLTFGLSGNVGGYNSEPDPDAFTGTYRKVSDHVLRSYLNISWLLNFKWITSLEMNASVNYTDRKQEESKNVSSSVAVASIHTIKEGYFIANNYDEDPGSLFYLIPAGYWFRTEYNDDKPVVYAAKLKARWVKSIGLFNNNLLLGGEFSYTGNYGQGLYYHDKRYAPSYRPFVYSDQPFVKNFAIYAENKATVPVFKKNLELQAGIRTDIASIKGSDYGVVKSFSPRINVRYTLIDNKNAFLKTIGLNAAWGDAVKLPPVNILFPRPTYTDKISFAPGALADGSIFYAHFSYPSQRKYNPELKWQRNRKKEIGIDLHIGKSKVSVTAFYDLISNPYNYSFVYSPFSYKLTDQRALNGSPIHYDNRSYTIDQDLGVVSVHDKTGEHQSYELEYKVINDLKANMLHANGSPVVKKGLEWVADFGRISAIRTAVRIDGSYFYYKGVDETLIYDKPSATNMADGNPYKYVGLYVGSSSNANGSISSKLTSNLILTTHIPALRMIFSFRLETCFYDFAHNLSEYSGGNRSFVLDNKDSYFPSESKNDIYAGNQPVAMYPLYYTSLDDMETLVPFAEKFVWARDNDRALYNELARMVQKTYYDYTFNPRRYAFYFSGNISLTKEIGKKLSISFQANNFFNNMAQVYSSQVDKMVSSYGSSIVPAFNYGLTLRLKI